eukprot:6190091-Pleurochrysis_carterae.AAC.1
MARADERFRRPSEARCMRTEEYIVAPSTWAMYTIDAHVWLGFIRIHKLPLNVHVGLLYDAPVKCMFMIVFCSQRQVIADNLARAADT